MSNINGLYENFPDDESQKRKKKKLYPSTEFVPGISGYLIKLFVSFIIFMLSVSLFIMILSSFMFLNELIFILLASMITMLVSWGTSLLFKEKSNFIKLMPIIILSIVIYFISPYKLLLTMIFIVYNFLTAIITLGKLNLPEKIALTQNFILVSCLFFCVYQIVFSIPQFKGASAIQARQIYMLVGLIWLFASIFVLNIMSIARNSSKNKMSKGLVKGNITITIIFAAIVAIISSIVAYKDFLIDIFKKVVLFFFRRSRETNVVIEGKAQEQTKDNIKQLLEETETSPFWDFLEHVMIIVFVLILAILVFFFLRMLIKEFKKIFSNLFSFLNDNDRALKINAYKDKEESVFDKSDLSNDFKSRWDNFKKVFNRKQKYDDMKNNREKVRYIFKDILARGKSNNERDIVSKTAKEYMLDEDDKINSEIFLNGYEKARYSNHEVEDNEVNAGLSITGNIK